MYEVIPGILEKEWDKIEEKLNIVRPFAKTVHIDLLDGKFAPNITFFDPKPFAKYSQEFFFELHMMVDDPIALVKSWADAGFKRFIGQVERMPDQEAFVNRVRGEKCEVGLALDVESKEDLVAVPFGNLDFLFVMTVKAGFSNQSFLPEQLMKVQALRAKTDKPIEVDGGISDQTIISAKDAGATRFVSTGFLFKSNNPQDQYKKLCGAVRI